LILTIGTTPAVARSMRFDRVTLDSVNRATSVIVSAAGKSVNVARVLRIIGQQVLCAGFAGGGPGKALRDDLTSLGIAHAFVETASSTRVCITVIDNHSSHATELIEEPGGVSIEEMHELSRVIHTHVQRAGVVVCAGALAPGVDETFYAEVVKMSATTPVIVDARGAALRYACVAGAIAKCNAQELAETFGETSDPARAALDAGAKAVLVTDGPRPARFVTPGAAHALTTPEVRVVSPIGSGDSVAAGLAAGIERGWSFVESARLGIACGCANAQTPVAGQVDPDEVLRLMQRVEVTDLR